ncbi:MAG: sulfatase-like hydrolase/transferase [Planctomycetota bacterium]
MPSDRPNLVFILADQLRHDTLGCAGHPVIQTPHIDRIAREGTRMRRCYAQCAVCGPGRSSMLTGHSVAATGVLDHPCIYGENADRLMPQPTHDEVLDRAGYHVEYYGKWHCPIHHARVYRNTVHVAGLDRADEGFGVPLEKAFKQYIDEHVPAADPMPGEQLDALYGRPYRMDPIDSRFGQPPSPTVAGRPPGPVKPTQPDNHGLMLIDPQHSRTAYEGRTAVAALDRLAEQDKPFGVHFDFFVPHAPHVVTEPYHRLYPTGDVPIPVSINDPLFDSPYKPEQNGGSWLPQYRDPAKLAHFISNYLGTVTELDHWIGAILDQLDTLGLADNTLVVFCSDHGEMLGAHGLREKNVFYEESARVPMMLRLPGQIPAGRVVETPVSTIDVFATLLDYLGTPAPPNHGRPWQPLINGQEDPDAAVVTEWHFHGPTQPNYMVRQGPWKYIARNDAAGLGIDGLYQLDDDPHEMTNLIGDHADRHLYQAVVQGMRAEWAAWADRCAVPAELRAGLDSRPILPEPEHTPQ